MRRPPLGRLAAWTVGLGLLLSLGLEAYRVGLGDNVHTVIPGRLYRSAQPKGELLRELVREYGIRSVINLRGECPEDRWYQAEVAQTAQLGLARYDINCSSYSWPSVPEFRELIRVLDTCEYPVLIHCRRGADRTGLAAAVAQLLLTDKTVGQARWQLAPRHGHIALGKTAALDEVLDMYEGWLAERGEPHRPELLRRWATTDYLPRHCWAEIEPLEVPAELPYGRPVAARFRVWNRSRYPWQFKQGANCGVHLHGFLRNENLTVAEEVGAGYFERTLQPGESIELTLALPAVRKPGRYRLKVDMADEQRGWFFMLGSPTFDTELELRGTGPRDERDRQTGTGSGARAAGGT